MGKRTTCKLDQRRRGEGRERKERMNVAGVRGKAGHPRLDVQEK